MSKEISNNVLTIDSREVAEMLGVEHKEIIRKIEGGTKEVGIIPTLMGGNFPLNNYFIESTYKDSLNRTKKCYLVTKMGCELLGNKQQGAKGILFSAKYVERFNEMEQQLQQPKLPKTYKEALQELLLQVEENERLEAENKKLENEVQEKEDVIIGLVDNIGVAEKRQIINRVVRKAGNKYQERWKALYQEFESKYHVDVKRRMDNYNKNNKPKINSKIDYIDKIMNMIPQLYEICCKLFYEDVEKLQKELYGIR